MRILTKEKIYEILNNRFNDGFLKLSSLPPPYTLKDASKAAKRVADALKNQEKIVVIGDYDVDGVVSSAIMREFFSYLDYPAEVIIPNRFKDGYGITKKLIQNIKADLIITVDNGISAVDAANYCKERGIDLIITDHHTPPKELPDAYAIINPKQHSCGFEYKDICGAEVAWFFIAQIKKELNLNLDMKKFLDLLSIAIIADVMPLKNINRALVQAGLKYFETSERPAVKFLRKSLKKDEFSADDIGFIIAPVLNSAGRMDSADLALKFLTSKDFFESSIFYSQLLALNSERKLEERRVLQEAKKQNSDKSQIFIAAGDDWHEGVVGIVASRVADRYKKPAIILTKKGEFYKGSGRSFANIDLFSLLDRNRNLLYKFGGHRKAAGLTIKKENLESLRDALNQEIKNIPKEDWIEESTVLGEIFFKEIDWELMDIIERFAPYGEENPMPKFVSTNVEVVEFREVGENGDHLLLTLRQDDRVFRGIKFRNSIKLDKNKIDIVYYPMKNVYNNSTYIQLNITDIL